MCVCLVSVSVCAMSVCVCVTTQLNLALKFHQLGPTLCVRRSFRHVVRQFLENLYHGNSLVELSSYSSYCLLRSVAVSFCVSSKLNSAVNRRNCQGVRNPSRRHMALHRAVPDRLIPERRTQMSQHPLTPTNHIPLIFGFPASARVYIATASHTVVAAA